jgi:hypothetical protein
MSRPIRAKAQELSRRGFFPLPLDVAPEVTDQQKVRRALADDLVGDVEISALRVLSRRYLIAHDPGG